MLDYLGLTDILVRSALCCLAAIGEHLFLRFTFVFSASEDDNPGKTMYPGAEAKARPTALRVHSMRRTLGT